MLLCLPGLAISQRGKSETLVILGIANSLHQDIRNAIDNRLRVLSVNYADIDDVDQSSYAWPDVDQVIATGGAGCESAVASPLKVPIVCVFLTAERFAAIARDSLPNVRRELTAIVIDQPVSRQAAVARKVYPALSRFAVLSQNTELQVMEHETDIVVSEYRSTEALASQLTDITLSLDALIATAESDIYNRSTLRTVLLTAYGYGKPVIGYSRAYVKAGALISGYSTPDQVFRQIAELFELNQTDWVQAITEDALADDQAMPFLVPKYFSIVDNPSVAHSLGLTKRFNFSDVQSYEDGDFSL